MDPSLASIASSLATISKAVILPGARRLYSERRAGVMPVIDQSDILDALFDETLDRLRDGNADDPWWQRLCDTIGHRLVTPEALKVFARQEWLADSLVVADFKALAGARIMGADADDERTLSRLRATHSERTGEDQRLATVPIEVVVAILVASVMAGLDASTRPIAGMAQNLAREARETRREVHELGETITRSKTGEPDRYVVAAQSQESSKELNRIKKRRSIQPEKTKTEIRQLANRVMQGDLCHSERSVRTDVLYWAARLHALQHETLPVAKGYLTKLLEEDPGKDTRIVDALILEEEGDVAGALRIFRDVDESDGRSNLFAVLCRKRGSAEALSWFHEQQGHDCPEYFTGPGWTSLAHVLVEANQWEEAAEYLFRAREHTEAWPFLPFLEGRINVVMLLPDEFRLRALRMELALPFPSSLRGRNSDESRSRGRACLEVSARLMAELGEEDCVQITDYWLLWLRLTDPHAAISDAARQEVQANMLVGQKAVDLLQFALSFDITFDPGPLNRHLARRAQLGGLAGRELLAELLLAKSIMPPLEFAAFLEREEQRLSQVAPRALLTGLRIDALIEEKQIVRARALLDERRNDFADYSDQERRLLTTIRMQEGEDPRTVIEALYEQSHSLIDLYELVRHLRQVGDWASLRSRLEELFAYDPNLKNAINLIDCMRRDPTSGDAAIVSFFEKHHTAADWGSELASMKAWALFGRGRLREAREINDRLIKERQEDADLQLDINIAIQAGDWERFPAIVAREWSKRDEHAAPVLLRLGSLAANAPSTAFQAYELAKLAVTKAVADPNVLLGAYILAMQLGREGETEAGWFGRAVSLSSAKGPVWKVAPRTVVEQMIPSHRERAREVDQKLLQGQIPLHLAATVLNVPLSRLLIDIPRKNAEIRDGRLRTVIPIISGARQALDIEPEWTIGLDVTSVIVLAYLDLLTTVLDSVKRVALPPETMILFLNDRRRILYHQPLRVRAAEEIRELIGSGLLKVCEPTTECPKWLVDEVGRDLAELLQAAQKEHGHVVRPSPIYKLDTFLEREADLREYASLVISTTAFARVLYEKGYIGEQTFEAARKYLSTHDRDRSESLDPCLLDRPIYVDDLAVAYLHQTGILRPACHPDILLRVHPSVREEQESIIAGNRESERLVEKIDEIRYVIKGVLESGKAILLPRHAGDEGEHIEFLTISQILADVRSCDAFCIDDRYINRHATLTDRAGRTVPIICVLDLVRYLVSQGVLNDDQRQALLHKLRCGGFSMVPLEADGLDWILRTARFGEGSCLVESEELRIVRQTLMRIRSLYMVDLAMEALFLERLRLASLISIRKLWSDDTVTEERAVALSDWIWFNIAPSPLDWIRNTREPSMLATAKDSFVHYIASMLNPLLPIGIKRHDGYCQWVERTIIEPLLPANAGAMANVVDLVAGNIGELCGQFSNESGQVSSILVNRQSLTIREMLLADDAFISRHGLKFREIINTGILGSFDQAELFSVARRALAVDSPQNLRNQEGEEIHVEPWQGSLGLRRATDVERCQQLQFNELMILSPRRDQRMSALRGLLEDLGPTAPDFSVLSQAAEERELTDREVDKLLSEVRGGVAGLQARAVAALVAKVPTIEDLVPNSLNYYERFCGPMPQDDGPEKYISTTLFEYRKELLRRDLKGGLQICLLGVLRDDLSPGSWTSSLEDDVLWKAMESCDPSQDPISLLGALDIALLRQHDTRFQSFAEGAVLKLTEDEFPRLDGIDTYQLLPLLASVVFDRINNIQGAVVQAPFWKRICAWMQAGFLLRSTFRYKLNYEALEQWCLARQTVLGSCARLVDLRREPMYIASEMSQKTFRAEVLARLRAVAARHKAANRAVPGHDKIDEAIRRFGDPALMVGWALPGPLNGHRRPGENEGFPLPEEYRKEAEQMLKAPTGAVWSMLAYISQICDLKDDLLALLPEASVRTMLPARELISRLADGGLIAASQRHGDLANSIADAILKKVGEACTVEEAIAMMRALIVTGAAFEQENIGAEWLGERFASLAIRLPFGAPSKGFLEYLIEAKKAWPFPLCVTSRSEALASAAY